MKRICWVILVVSLLVGRSAVGFTEDATMVAGMHTDESVKALALQWFTQMQVRSNRPHAIGCDVQCPVEG